MSFIDPRVWIAAIPECRSAGIEVKMIIGDHAAAAAAIARQLGLGEDPQVVAGRELDEAPDTEWPALQAGPTSSPEPTPSTVADRQALQSTGAVVAMTGDGVNDAASLKQADIGISMGRKGTDAAKEASELVLLDDNIASTVAAVHEERVVFDNIREVAAWTFNQRRRGPGSHRRDPLQLHPSRGTP